MITATERVHFFIRRVYHRMRRDARTAMRPFGTARDLRYWNEVRNQHAGRRGFVIGCGPSLCTGDLDRLRGEVTLASNRIDLAFDSTTWRPDYFALSDWVLFPKIRQDLIDNHDVILGGPDMPRHVRDTRVVQWRWRGRPVQPPNGTGEYCFSADVSAGIWSGGTITFDLIQIAAHLGLNPIILVGCDHQYQGEEGVDPRGLLEAPDVQNHFHPRYRTPGERVRPACMNLMTRAFQHARAWSEANGVQILNATRGGSLDVFPRVSLDEILEELKATTS